MKKILIVFIFFIALFVIEVKAENKYADLRWIPNVYYNYQKNGILYWGQMAYIIMDGKMSYCIDINKNITSDSYTISNETNINDEMLLYGYFGYGYSSNVYFNDYLATQKLIWRSLGVEVYYTTDSNGNGNIINVDNNVNNINKYIEEYKKSFSLESDFEFEIGNVETIKIDRTLDNFIVENTGNNSVQLAGNEIMVYPYQIGNYSFKLKENYLSRGENKIYISNNSQTILQVGTISNREYLYDYSIRSGKLELNINNSITNSNTNVGMETLNRNVFNLYTKDYFLMGSYETDAEGKLIIDNMYPGDYILEHLYVSEGYSKDKVLYNFSISSGNLNPTIDIMLKPRTTNLFIKKAYGNPKVGTYFLDSNVSFDFYNSKGEIVNNVTTDEYGEASIELTYDEYNVVQSSINRIEEKVPEYKINIDDFDSNNYYDIYTPVYDSKLKLYLYELGSTIPIPNFKIMVGGKEYITNNEGYIKTEYLNEGLNCIYQSESDNYVLNNEICVEINENSNFYIEDDDVYVDFTIYNEKKKVDKQEINIENNQEIVYEDALETKSITEAQNIADILPNLFSNFFEITKGTYKC